MSLRHALLALLCPVAVVACSSSPSDDGAPEERCLEEGVSCQAYGRQNWQNKAPAYELGNGTTPPALTMVFQGAQGRDPVDLEFNPKKPKELWVMDYGTSAVTVIQNPGLANQSAQEIRDPAYSHFMYRPPAIAFGSVSPKYTQQWATCGNGDNGGNYFMGPTLYSSDLQLFGKQTPNGLGTHLDMLHSTSFCRGIAWGAAGNQYWTFNAYDNAVDFYDFRADHGPGNDDHSDGVIRRFWKNQVLGVNGLVSHLSMNRDDSKLYVADTGHKRILVLDPTGGHVVAPLAGMEPTVERAYWETPVKVLVAPGTLEAPSGIEASGGLVFVSDAATSKIHAFDIATGALVRSLATNLPANSLAGLNFGPDGKIYFVDRLQNRVFRVDP